MQLFAAFDPKLALIHTHAVAISPPPLLSEYCKANVWLIPLPLDGVTESAVTVAPINRRTSLPADSVTYTLPDPSTAIPSGESNCALEAIPPSPEKPGIPVPAMVLMTPPLETKRTRWLLVSAINKFPPASTATPYGALNSALAAALPSPPKPGVPFPATVEMIPPDTLRMRLLN